MQLFSATHGRDAEKHFLASAKVGGLPLHVVSSVGRSKHYMFLPSDMIEKRDTAARCPSLQTQAELMDAITGEYGGTMAFISLRGRDLLTGQFRRGLAASDSSLHCSETCTEMYVALTVKNS